MNRSVTTVLAALAVTAPGALAGGDHDHAHEGDVYLAVENARIITGIFDDIDGFEPERVFGVELGEIVPGAADEPGFDNASGTFVNGTALGVHFRSALSIWDGAGLASATQTMTFEFGPQSMVSGAGFVSGFDIAVGADDEWHEHYDMFISDALAIGVYVLELELFSTDPGLSTSAPFWFVFNNGESELVHDEVIEYVETVLVPAPAAAGLLGLAGLAATRRRR